MALALAAPAAAPAASPTLVLGPDEPGPVLPPAGRSLFDELFGLPPPAVGGASAIALPFPFERMLERLNAEVAPAEVVPVLIPLGRSLQRFAADPDYFASPRVVVAVPEDAGGDRPLLRDRLFLGYHERAATIEVISYNEAAGRFEFQVVEDYGAGLTPRVEYAERSICVACHQAHGPIFPTALWNETNADPRVAEHLAAGLGESFQGMPTRGGVDRADAFDRSTDRAGRLAFANLVWAEACGEAAEPGSAACRGQLLLAALRYRLGGARATAAREDHALAARIAGRLARLAPGGLGTPSPDLPNRDPLALIDAGVPGDAAIDPDGVFDPSLPRTPLLYWRPSEPPAALLGRVVGEIATCLADADVIWLDRMLLRRTASDLGRWQARCSARTVDRGDGRREIRFDCANDEIALDGYLTLTGEPATGGLVRTLTLAGREPVHRLVVTGARASEEQGTQIVELALREAGLGLSARLAAGERLSPLSLWIGPEGEAGIELAVVDDLGPLQAALARMTETAVSDPAAALGAGPLRRRAVLAELRSALEGH